MKKILAFCFSLVLTAAFCLPIVDVSAQTTVNCNVPANFSNQACKAGGLLESAGGGAGYQKTATVSSIVGLVIKAFLTLLGVIFLVLTVYAGFLWMTARGEEKQVEDAKGILKNAIIGLVIILLAYSLTTFVVSQLVEATE